MAFAGVWLSMHHMRDTDGVWLKRLYDLDSNFLASTARQTKAKIKLRSLAS